MARIGGREVATNDIGVMGAGFLVFIFSFLPWYGYKIKSSLISTSDNTNAWAHIGAAGWFACLICLAAAGLVAAQVFGGVRVPTFGPVRPALIPVGIGALAVVLILLRWVTYDRPNDGDLGFSGSVEAGARVGTYLALIGAIALTVFAVLRMRAGEPAPAGGPRPPYGQPQGWPQGQPQPGQWQGGPQQVPPGTWPQGQQPGGWQQPPQGQQQGGWQQQPPQGGGWQQQPPQGGWPGGQQ